MESDPDFHPVLRKRRYSPLNSPFDPNQTVHNIVSSIRLFWALSIISKSIGMKSQLKLLVAGIIYNALKDLLVFRGLEREREREREREAVGLGGSL